MRSTRTRKVANEPLNLSALVEADPPDFDIKIVDKETGYGVFSRKHFEKGEPLFLYRGTKSVGSLDVMDDSYVFEFSHKGTIYCIDASKNDKSLGRMVNDENRSPNCLPKVVEVMGQPYVVFFALRTIHPGDELRYNYGSGNYPWRKKKRRLAECKEYGDQMTFTEDSDQSKEAEVRPASDASVVTETSPSERVYGDQMTFTEDSDQSKEAEVGSASDASVVTETSPSETEYGDQMTFTEDSDQSKEAEVRPASDASVVTETSPSERVYGDQMTFTEDSDQSKEAEVWPASDASVVTETSPSETEYGDQMTFTEDSDQSKEAEVRPASDASVVTETSPSERVYGDQMTFTEDSDQSKEAEVGSASDASVVTETSPSETEYGDQMTFTEDSDQSKEAEVGPASDASVVTETSPSERVYGDQMTFTEDSDQSKEAEVGSASDASVVTETSPSETEYGDQMTFTEDSDQSKEAEVGPASDASVVTETSPSERVYGDQMTFTEDSDQSKEAEVWPASDASVVIETLPSETVYGDQMTFTEDSDQSKEAEVWPASDASVVTETSPSETEYSDKMKLTEDSDQRKEAEEGPASHVSVVTETSPSETDYSDQMTFTEDSVQSHKVEEGPSSVASVVTETSPSETGDETVFSIYIEEPEKSVHVQGDVLFAVNKCNSGFQLEQLEEYVSDSDCSSIVETATNRPISLHKVLKASADSTSDGSEEQAPSRELPGIVIQAVTGSGKRDYTKKHCCFFCEKSISKIGRHLEKAHQDVPEIRELPPVSKNNSTSEIAKRKIVLSKYRNLGNFNHNISVLLKKKGIFYVGRRPPKEKGNSASSYLPCPYCLTFLVKSELWRHVKICSFKENKLTVSNAEELKKATDECVSSAEYILQGALGTEVYNSDNQEFIDHVVKRFHMDNVSLAVKSDKLLLIFGNMQLRKLGLQRACQVREKLRILGRVKIELRSLTGLESADMDSFITPSKFDICMKAVRNLSGESNEGSSTGSKTFKRPSLALKAGQLLKRIAVLKRGQAIRKLDLSKKDETDQFISLYKEEFSEVISSLAHHTLSERKYNKKVLLPLTKDLLKYMNYLESTTIESTRLFLDCPCSSHWNTLAEVTIARIILFNKRRASEGAKMLVSQFVGRPAYGKENEELVSTLQPIEKQLMKTMSLVEVVGKQYKRVPILLSQTMVEAIQALVDKRAEGGVRSCNPYVFAQGDSNFKRGSDCIRRTVQACELEFPERITSTKLRKYLATVSQVFNLSESELGELARHMGHELSVHRRFYRLQDDVIELAKVSRLLMSVEEGKAAQFAGCTLDDINLEDFEEVEEEEDVGDDEDGVEVDFDPHLDAVENIVPSSHPSKESVVQDDVLDTDEDVVACAPPSKKRVVQVSNKRIWSNLEKEQMQSLVLEAVRKKRPPCKADVVKFQLTNGDKNLKSLPWLKLKHQVWAMAQSIIKKKEKVVAELMQ